MTKISGPKHLAIVLGGNQNAQAVRAFLDTVRSHFFYVRLSEVSERWHQGNVVFRRRLKHPFEAVTIEVWARHSKQMRRQANYMMRVKTSSTVRGSGRWSATVRWNYIIEPLVFDELEGNLRALTNYALLSMLRR